MNERINIQSIGKVTFIILLASMLKVSAFGQDMQFSQFAEPSWWRNPSLTGLFKGDFKATANYRSQWASIVTPYETMNVNLEYKSPVGRADDYVTFGGTIQYDKAGEASLTRTNILPGITYHKALSADRNRYLSLGFTGGMVQRRFDPSKVKTDAMFSGSPDELFNNSNITYWDGSVGMSYNSSIGLQEDDNFYIGVAYHHFNKPKTSFYKDQTIELDPRITVSAGIRYSLSEHSYFTAEADYSQQSAFNALIVGGMYSVKVGDYYDNPEYIFHFGGYIRWKDAFIPAVKLDYKNLGIGITYDANISRLKTVSQTRGGIELSIGWKGFLNSYSVIKDAVIQPRF